MILLHTQHLPDDLDDPETDKGLTDDLIDEMNDIFDDEDELAEEFDEDEDDEDVDYDRHDDVDEL